MIRRPWGSAVLAGIVVVIVLLVAASSEPVRLFRVTSSSSGVAPAQDAEPAAGVTTATTLVPDELVDRPGQAGAWLQVLGGVVGLFALAMLRRSGWGWEQMRGRVAQRRARRRGGLVLPRVATRPLDIDVEAAHAALADGTPRNAIVACWLELERGAAEVGLPRAPAETSVEYVARVISSSSVDPGPIAELASLYREARFSSHELGADHRRRAAATLGRVAEALRLEGRRDRHGVDA